MKSFVLHNLGVRLYNSHDNSKGLNLNLKTMSSIKLSSSKDSSKKQSEIILPERLILQSDENNPTIYNQSSKKISSLTKSEIKSNSKFHKPHPDCRAQVR